MIVRVPRTSLFTSNQPQPAKRTAATELNEKPSRGSDMNGAGGD